MLLPKEHGAYAQLAFPLLSGLLAGTPLLGAAAFVVAAVALFLASEPLEVLIGARGARAHDTLARPARIQLVAMVALGVFAGLLAIAASAPAARVAAFIPAALGAVLGILVLARRIKTLPGEIGAVAAFASLHLPIAAAGGASGVRLWGPAAVWFAVFVSATFAVHAMKARHKGRDAALVTTAVAIAAAVLIAALAVALAGSDARLLGWAALAPAAAALYVAARPVHPRHLKRVGWALVGANALALVVMSFLPG
jgi:hypothetical protein